MCLRPRVVKGGLRSGGPSCHSMAKRFAALGFKLLRVSVRKRKRRRKTEGEKAERNEGRRRAREGGGCGREEREGRVAALHLLCA